MATLVTAFLSQRRRPWVRSAAVLSVVLVGLNAWMGSQVVSSDLKPVVLTVHMALAMFLLMPLAFAAWRGGEQPWLIPGDENFRRRMRMVVGVLLILIFAEGVLGTRIREMNSQLGRTHQGMGRAEWIGILEGSWVYLVHRSFSWVILAAAVTSWQMARKAGRPGRVATGVLVVVLGQMVLGLIMARVEILPVIQVLHVGLSGILLTLATLWFCGTFRPKAEVMQK
jgi:cytochrome c oxidase assembly protein subunit 15